MEKDDEIEKRAAVAACRNYSLYSTIQVATKHLGPLTIAEKRKLEDVYYRFLAMANKLDNKTRMSSQGVRFCYFCTAPVLGAVGKPVCDKCQKKQVINFTNNVYYFPDIKRPP